MKTRTVVRSSALLLACLSLAACSDDDHDAEANSLSLSPCTDDPMLDCGVLDVPLIHDSTDTRRMKVDVLRLPGTGEGPHETLMVNPGGPGASGTAMVRQFARRDALPAALRERYDLVGFDPRGIGIGERIDCERFGLDDLDDYPLDESSLEGLIVDTGAVADACSADYGDTLQWLGSNAVVADMDALRELLDAPTLNLIGYSYGTRLAALYLQRYPDRSGRMVLDGSLPPGNEIVPLVIGQVEAQQRNLERLLDACGLQVTPCDRDRIDEALIARVQALIENGDEALFELFGTLVLEAVERPLAAQPLAPVLVRFLLDGEPAPLIAAANALGVTSEEGDEEGDEADEPDGPDGPDGGQPSVDLDEDNTTVRLAVICADDASRPTRASLAATGEELAARSDLFAAYGLAFATRCTGWPAALDPVADIATDAAPVSLVIGGVNDAQTPIEWAAPMAEAIGGRLLTSDHDGHTTVFNGKSACVDAAVTAWLLDGELPAGASCARDTDVAEGS